jgi:hypothetical protein
LGGAALCGALVSVPDLSTLEARKLGAIALAACQSADVTVRRIALEALDEMPLSWLLGQADTVLVDVAPEFAGPIVGFVTLLLDPRTIGSLLRLLGDSRTDADLRVRVVRALGATADLAAFPALLAIGKEGPEEPLQAALAQALSLFGPLAWPQLLPLLVARRTPSGLLAAALLAVALATESVTQNIEQYLSLLSHEDPDVRKAAARALRLCADQPLILLPFANPVTAAANDYVGLLASVLGGGASPDVGVALMRWSGSPSDAREPRQRTDNAEPEEKPPNDEEATLLEHLGVYAHSAFTAGLCALLAALVGARVSTHAIPALALLYGVSPDAVAAYLPTSSSIVAQYSMIVFVLWLGIPASLYQLVRFVSPALYKGENRLFLRAVGGLGAVLLVAPLTVALVAHAASAILAITSSEYEPGLIILAVNRISALLSFAVFGAAAGTAALAVLALQVRAAHVLQLYAGSPILRPTSHQDQERRLFLILGTLAGFAAALLPTYIVGACLFGLLEFCVIWALPFYAMCSQGRQPTQRYSGVGRFALHCEFSVLRGVLYSAPITVIMLALFSILASPVNDRLCQILYGGSSLQQSCFHRYTESAAMTWAVQSAWAGTVTLVLGMSLRFLWFQLRRALWLTILANGLTVATLLLPMAIQLSSSPHLTSSSIGQEFESSWAMLAVDGLSVLVPLAIILVFGLMAAVWGLNGPPAKRAWLAAFATVVGLAALPPLLLVGLNLALVAVPVCALAFVVDLVTKLGPRRAYADLRYRWAFLRRESASLSDTFNQTVLDEFVPPIPVPTQGH